MLPFGHWRQKLKICRLFHANMCKFDGDDAAYNKLRCAYNSKRCRYDYVCNRYYYDRAVHISVAVETRMLLDRNHFSSSSNGQVAAHRVTGLIILFLPSFLPYTSSALSSRLICSGARPCLCHATPPTAVGGAHNSPIADGQWRSQGGGHGGHGPPQTFGGEFSN